VTGAGPISKAWLWTFGVSSLNLACGVVTGILAARFLLPEGRGVLAAITFWPGLIWSLAMLGLRDAVAHRIAQSTSPTATVVASGFYVTLGLAALTAAVTALALPFLLGEARRPFWLAAEIYAVTFIPLSSLVATLRAIDQGELRFARYNLWGLSSALVYLCGLLTIWALDLISVTTALAAFWLGTALTALALLASRARQLRARPSRAESAHLFRLGASFQTTNLAFLLGTQIDRLTVILFWGDAAVGLYVVALTWAFAGLNTITFSFRTVLFPHLAAEADAGRRRALLADGIRYASCLLTFATLALASVTGWLLPLLFGTSFAGAVPVALALLAAFWPLALRQVAIQSLRGLGQVRPGTIAESIAILVFVACVWPLGQGLGLLGVALGVLLGNLASLAYLMHHLRRQFAIAPRAWWGFNPATVREIVRIGLGRLAALGPRRPPSE
jgi:O-antigen/teichoic acid export membrane protein